MWSPGGLLICMIDAGDGSYLAAVESRNTNGMVTVSEYRDDARNFFEACGWALSEATMVSRCNGENQAL